MKFNRQPPVKLYSADPRDRETIVKNNFIFSFKIFGKSNKFYIFTMNLKTNEHGYDL